MQQQPFDLVLEAVIQRYFSSITFTEWKWESVAPFRPWNFPSFWMLSVSFLPCFQTDHLFSNSSISCQMHPVRTNWNCYILFARISLSCKFIEDVDHHPSTSSKTPCLPLMSSGVSATYFSFIGVATALMSINDFCISQEGLVMSK